MEVHSTLPQRIADWIAWFSGIMPFLSGFLHKRPEPVNRQRTDYLLFQTGI